MTKTLAAILAAGLVLGGCSISWGTSTTVTETRGLPEFDRISINGPMDVEVRVAAAPQVRVKADEAVADRILTFVEGDTLVVTTTGSFSTRGRIVVYVETTALSQVLVDGAGDATITGLGGGGLAVVVRGSGDVEVSGTVDELEVVSSGSGDVDLRRLEAKRATVDARGSGDVGVYATEFLKVALDGSGDVDYWGDPHKVGFRDTGSGDINPR